MADVEGVESVLCAFPVSLTHPDREVSCGQCQPCRVNRRRAWTGRLLLEGLMHWGSSFVTLTYDPENMPRTLTAGGEVLGTLYPRDLTLCIKRLRDRSTAAVRYFAVGEYGSQTWRPHYHLAIYGPDPLWVDQLMPTIWGKGWVKVDEMTEQRAAYIAHYTTKKMMQHEDERLDGRYPEFSRSSRRPGIGVPAIPLIGRSLRFEEGRQHIDDEGDVPREIRYRGKRYPLDTTMLKYLREFCHVPELAGDRKPREAPEIAPEDRLDAERAHDKMLRRHRNHGTL